MDTTLKGFVNNCVVVYLNDFLIYSKTEKETEKKDQKSFCLSKAKQVSKNEKKRKIRQKRKKL